MKILSHALVWLSRLPRSRGFGIQSPADYRFARYVVGERWPYYAYEQLRKAHPHASRQERRIGQLCLRLANYRQPREILAGTFQDYLQAGCRKATIVAESTAPIELALFSTPCDAIQHELQYNEGSVVMVNSIRYQQDLWQQLASSPKAVTVFDLYHCAIVLCDPSRPRQYYKINL